MLANWHILAVIGKNVGGEFVSRSPVETETRRCSYRYTTQRPAAAPTKCTLSHNFLAPGTKHLLPTTETSLCCCPTRQQHDMVEVVASCSFDLSYMYAWLRDSMTL